MNHSRRSIVKRWHMGTIQQRDTARNCTKRSRLALSLVCARNTTNMKLIFIVVIIYIVVPFMLGSWLRATQYTNYYYQTTTTIEMLKHFKLLALAYFDSF